MRRRILPLGSSLSFLVIASASAACGGGGTAADRLGIASECTSTPECPTVTLGDGGTQRLECLTNFAGGYCGLSPCASSAECPEGSICVTHTDAVSYCFRVCRSKSECNQNRPTHEANCSANFVWASPADDDGSKACIPPSSGM